MSKRIEINLDKKLPELKTAKVHFIGVGGIGVSGVAKCFCGLGFQVSGSDMKSNKNTELLESLGAKIYLGHKAENVLDVDFIITSSAIKQDNPEIVQAKKQGIEIFHRSHALEFLLRQSTYSIGFSGTHGKTTSTGMSSLVFELSGKNPTSVIGGMLPQIQTNAKLGSGDFAIAELDESDGTILLYQPSITVVTNLEVDHVDHYTDGFSQLLDTFKTFVSNLEHQSKLVLNADDSGVMRLYDEIDFENVIFYSLNDANEARYNAKNIIFDGLSSSFDFYENNVKLGNIDLSVPGEHNVSNAMGVIASSLEAGLTFEEIQKSLHEFIGTGRRFEYVGEYNQAKIYDDYAHHPTEVTATLKSAKALGKRVVAVFQPHRYSRLQGLWEDFKDSFLYADCVVVTDVFPAGEAYNLEYNGESFAKEIGANYVPGTIDSIQDNVVKFIQPDDIVLTIGAGDITQLGRKICSK